MIHNLSPGMSAERLSRRAAAGRLVVASAAVGVTHFRSLHDPALGATSRGRSAHATIQDATTMTDASPPNDNAPLTVMLVHGAFADSSSWNGVIERLEAAGVPVTAPPNPLRGVSHDSAYIASLLNQTTGPVLLVGHSYGGVVITNAPTLARNVVGLVYVAGLAPDEGETLMDLEGDSRDSVLTAALVPRQYPTGQGVETAVEFVIDPARLQDAFAADLPVAQTAVMAATQRPVSEFAFSETTGVPAWKSLPTWAVVATGDKAAGTDVVRSTAKRAGAMIDEVEGSHAILISRPQAVSDVILRAVQMVS